MGPVPEDWPQGQAKVCKVREDWTAETPRIGGFRPQKSVHFLPCHYDRAMAGP